MIEVAALMSALIDHWPDFAIIMVLLVYNAVSGFWQERKAADALAALKAGMAPKARVLRDGKFISVDAAELVPGDVIEIKLGDVVPADVRFIAGEYISIDQAALTGESLPVDKKVGDSGYSGSIAKKGEMTAVVIINAWKWADLVNILRMMLVLLIASIPVAMPTPTRWARGRCRAKKPSFRDLRPSRNWPGWTCCARTKPAPSPRTS